MLTKWRECFAFFSGCYNCKQYKASIYQTRAMPMWEQCCFNCFWSNHQSRRKLRPSLPPAWSIGLKKFLICFTFKSTPPAPINLEKLQRYKYGFHLNLSELLVLYYLLDIILFDTTSRSFRTKIRVWWKSNITLHRQSKICNLNASTMAFYEKVTLTSNQDSYCLQIANNW